MFAIGEEMVSEVAGAVRDWTCCSRVWRRVRTWVIWVSMRAMVSIETEEELVGVLDTGLWKGDGIGCRDGGGAVAGWKVGWKAGGRPLLLGVGRVGSAGGGSTGVGGGMGGTSGFVMRFPATLAQS